MTPISCRSSGNKSPAMIPFVGRAREICEVTEALAEGTNVVLVGPYGIGRTALVRQVARSMRGRWRFVFADFSGTPGEASDSLIRALSPRRREGRKADRPGHKLRRLQIVRVESGLTSTVLVMEDIARFTDPVY